MFVSGEEVRRGGGGCEKLHDKESDSIGKETKGGSAW